MLVTIRSFASQHLMEFGQKTVLRERRAEYFLQLAVEADQHVHGPDQIE
jgi:hypothetical protein